MKFLVLAACLSVSASQGFFGLVAHPNGAITPVDEPRVAALRADHLATKFGAGHVAYAAAPIAPAYAAHAAPVLAHAGPVAVAAHAYAPAYAYSGPLNLNTHLVGHPNGAIVPVDEPAVAAARADHFAAGGGHAEYAYAAHAAPILAHAGPIAVAAHAYAPAYGHSGPLNLNTHLVGHPNGAIVPVDEPAVAAARADHFAAHAVEYAHAGPVLAHAGPIAVAAHAYAPAYAYSGPLNLNTHLVGHPNGAIVPVDEPAVAAARADHFAAGGGHAEYAHAAPLLVHNVPDVVHGHATHGFRFAGPLNLNTHLVAHPNGAVVPVDEPAVAAARADHFAAKGLHF